MVSEGQTGMKLKILRSEKVMKFANETFVIYIKQHAILRQLTVPYAPQQDGVAELFNRTLIEMVRYMMLSTSVGELI